MRTDEQQRQTAQALDAANRTRLANARWRQTTASLPPVEGADRLADLLTDQAALDGDHGSMTVVSAILSVHRIGTKRADTMLRRAAIVPIGDRRLRDLSARQRVVLAFQLYNAGVKMIPHHSIPVEVFRERFEQLRAAGEMTESDLAGILGWYTTKGSADSDRVRRTFGVKKHTSKGRRYSRERINYSLAVRLCDALGLDYTEIGV